MKSRRLFVILYKQACDNGLGRKTSVTGKEWVLRSIGDNGNGETKEKGNCGIVASQQCSVPVGRAVLTYVVVAKRDFPREPSFV